MKEGLNLIKVKAPGKLYIAGEYAVVNPGIPSVIVALNRFVYAEIEENNSVGTISSNQYKDKSLTFFHDNSGKLIYSDKIEAFNFIIEAINIVEKLVIEKNIPLKLFSLHFDSDLDNTEGKKYGLGSSAAVTVATIKALQELYQLNLKPLDIFKLAALAHYNVQGNGSLGDIAASAFTGWISYKRFDWNWLNEFKTNHTLTDLLNATWPLLEVQQLDFPDDLELVIGWTGSPASTSKLVSKIKDYQQTNPKEYSDFVKNSSLTVNNLISSINQNDYCGIKNALENNREILKELSLASNVEIETPLLTKLIESVIFFGGMAKTSGAGGGDCGIGIISKSNNYKELYQKWEEIGITPLNFRVYIEK